MPFLQTHLAKAQFWTAPNQITLLRLIFIPFVIIAVLDAHWRWALALLIAALIPGLVLRIVPGSLLSVPRL